MNPKEIISGKRVLIVDNEQDVLDTLASLLEIDLNLVDIFSRFHY